MKKNILIIGGAGFIGSNLIEELVKNDNFNLTSLDCYFTGKKENHISGVDYINGYSWDIFEIFKKNNFDVIYHFGEYSRIVYSFKDINFVSESILRGTSKVLEFARTNNSKLIYSASSSKFGNKGLDENLSPYAWMKAKIVELIKNYNSWFNLSYEIAYFYNVYGPKQIYDGKYATVVAIFEKQYKANTPCTVVKPGSQSRDFTHVNDIVSGLIEIMDTNMNHEWHFRSGQNIKLVDLAKMFGSYCFIEERRGERFTSESFENDTERILNWSPKKDLKDWINNIKTNK